mgnify:CR=1 FL=1
MTRLTLKPRSPTPCAAVLRDELETLVVKDLLGPAGGPVEEIDEKSPITARYLVGKLSRRDQEIPRDPDDELAVADEDSPEGGGTEPSTAGAASLYPSSLGLSFTPAPDAKALAVRAEWGWYKREKSEDVLTDKGNPKTVWRRYPMEGAAEVDLREGALAPEVLNDEQPDLVLRGQMRRGADRVWHVSLFLVNNQIAGQQGRKKGERWLFQPLLWVASTDGRAVFVRQTPAGSISVIRGAPRRRPWTCCTATWWSSRWGTAWR